MHLIVYGPEGSGKGTQAQLLGDKLNLPVLTSGDLVREAAKKQKNKIGEIARRALETGHYVADEVMFGLWQKKLGSKLARQGFILDGFPRNAHQADFLLTAVGKLGYSIDAFIYLRISNKEAFRRLLKRKRKIFPGSKISHDTPSRIKKRLLVYRLMEKDIVKLFRQKGLLKEIDGEKEVTEVFQSILSELPKKS